MRGGITATENRLLATATVIVEKTETVGMEESRPKRQEKTAKNRQWSRNCGGIIVAIMAIMDTVASATAIATATAEVEADRPLRPLMSLLRRRHQLKLLAMGEMGLGATKERAKLQEEAMRERPMLQKEATVKRAKLQEEAMRERPMLLTERAKDQLSLQKEKAMERPKETKMMVDPLRKLINSPAPRVYQTCINMY
ncbi:hypothetical protein QR680_007759 [Steinernema hermaphroditum]|uniref:Uncharacterized protein n=1 Tax=Steinernema hermaphroditum TaxID=289476 RepID=A0AA39M5V2_9BILA|nr:hypothetical protein QR680_007759 [Steinernema hermaphroditum]